MTCASGRSYDADFLDTLSQRVMVGDGAVGAQLQAADLTLVIETKYVRLQSG